MNTQTIAFVAGRSGGHIIPALTLAQQRKTDNPTTQILFFTTAHPLDQSIIKKQGASISKHVPLKLGNVPLFNIFKIVVFAIYFARALYKSYIQLRAANPEQLIAMGGYISIPVCLAAHWLKIPIYLYDLDTKPGKTTRLLQRYAQKIYICFEEAQQSLPAQKCALVPYPIRFEQSAKELFQEDARIQLSLLPNKKTIFINGGSQGSLFINTMIKDWLEMNPHLYSLIQIIHQTGTADSTNWQSLYQDLEIPAFVFTYKENLAPCYSAADVIISRAGAGSLFEALFFNKPCIMIPLETSSTTHQKNNAHAFSSKYPALFTLLTEHEIRQDNMMLFRILNRYIYVQPSQHNPYRFGRLGHTHQNF